MENDKNIDGAGLSLRRHTRHRVRVKTLVSAGKAKPFWANLAEISESGLSLVSDTSIMNLVKARSEIVILFLLPSQAQQDQVRIEVCCKLVHEYVSAGQFRCGLSMNEFRNGKSEMIKYLLGITD